MWESFVCFEQETSGLALATVDAYLEYDFVILPLAHLWK